MTDFWASWNAAHFDMAKWVTWGNLDADLSEMRLQRIVIAGTLAALFLQSPKRSWLGWAALGCAAVYFYDAMTWVGTGVRRG